MRLRYLSLILLIATLSACELLGIPDPAKEAERKDAEGKAIGSACRHAGRALEDCFALNTTAQKASVFAGWKEMNDYMAQNKIDTVKPELVSEIALAAQKQPHTEASAPEGDGEESASTPKPSKSRSKSGAKTENTATTH